MSFTQPLADRDRRLLVAPEDEDPHPTAVDCYLLACDLLIKEIGKRRARRLFGQCYRALEDA